jgi:polyhydroxyalkanoate synthesis regulator phasin
MDELLKKLLYTGVGLVAITAEKLQTVVNDLVKEEKITTEEGKKLVEDFVKNTESKKDELETQLKQFVEKSVKSFSFATTQQVEDLTARLEALEAKHKATKVTAKKEEVTA